MLSFKAFFKRLLNTTAAGTSTLTATFDREGFDAFLARLLLGDVADTSVITMKAGQGDLANGSDAVDISGASATFTANASSADNKVLALDVKQPSKRYITITVTRATANAAVDGLIVDMYNAMLEPVATTNYLAITQKFCG